MMRHLFITLLTPLAHFFPRVNPNTLTIFSLITGMLAGLSYWLTHISPMFFGVGAVLVAFSGLADSLDGILARMYERTTKFGDFLDHFCDRVVDVSILLGLAASPHADAILGLSIVIILLLNNTLGAQIEASFGQRCYGPGKAELFVGLVIFSVFMAFFPDISLRVGKNTITFINILFFLLGTASIGSIIHRFYKVHKLCSINIAEKKDGT